MDRNQMSGELCAFKIAKPCSFPSILLCFSPAQFVADINDLIAANREVAALKENDFNLSSAIGAVGFGQAFVRVSSLLNSVPLRRNNFSKEQSYVETINLSPSGCLRNKTASPVIKLNAADRGGKADNCIWPFVFVHASLLQNKRFNPSMGFSNICLPSLNM